MSDETNDADTRQLGAIIHAARQKANTQPVGAEAGHAGNVGCDLDETERAFTRKVERIAVPIICRYLDSHPNDQPDVLQETHIAILNNLATLIDPRGALSPEGWIAGVARNQCLLYFRRLRLREKKQVSLPVPSSESLEMFSQISQRSHEDRDQEMILLKDFIETKLLHIEKQVVELLLAGYQGPEICAALGAPA